MVRELQLDYTVEGFTAKDLYQLVFLNDELTRQFHAEVNKDPNAEVGPWQDDKRIVKFTMEVNLPASLRKIIGEGTFPVSEKQEVTWVNGEDAFQASSTPRIQLSVAAGFITKVLFKVATQQGTATACHLGITVTCTANGIWPLQSTVEGIMIEEGRMRVGGFADFVVNHLKKVRAERDAAAAAAAAAAPEGRLPEVAAAATAVSPSLEAAAAPAPAPAAALPTAAAGQPSPALPLAPAPAAAAAGVPAGFAVPQPYEGDLFYDAAEELPSAAAHALVAQQQVLQKLLMEVQATNRHMEAMSRSVQHIDLEVTRALAFQEGVRAGQRAAQSSSYLWGSLLLAAAVAGSTGMLLMRSKSRS